MEGGANPIREFRSRWRVCLDASAGWERRIFALLELCCFPVSFVMIFAVLPLEIVGCRWLGWKPFGAWSGILLSASVGYLTNYIALEMLFKPYRRTWKHPLALLSCGYWRQGLIPKNKDRIGGELGRQIETRLLDPEKMADELCTAALGLLHRPDVVGVMRDGVREMLLRHERNILDFLTPRIQASIGAAAERFLSPERIQKLWRSEFAPHLQSAEVRSLAARNIVDALKRRSPQLMEILRRELREFSFDYFSRNLPFGVGAASLSDGLVGVIRWDEVESRISAKLGDEEVRVMIEQEVLVLTARFNEFISGEEGRRKVAHFTANVRNKTDRFLREYLRRTLPRIAAEIIDAEELWQWIETRFLPMVQPHLEELIRTVGKREIIAELHLSQRVAEAVEKQRVEDFHDMITAIAAQHLGAIQVLGFFLGGLVGVFQLLR